MNNTLKFRKVNATTYEVRTDGSDTLAGTVEKVTNSSVGTFWQGRYNDGDKAYGGWTRNDAAWSLINS